MRRLIAPQRARIRAGSAAPIACQAGYSILFRRASRRARSPSADRSRHRQLVTKLVRGTFASTPRSTSTTAMPRAIALEIASPAMRRRHRADDQAIDPLPDQFLNVGFLLTRIVAGVQDGQPLDAVAETGGGIFDAVNEGDAPRLSIDALEKPILKSRRAAPGQWARKRDQRRLRTPRRFAPGAGGAQSSAARGLMRDRPSFDGLRVRGDQRLASGPTRSEPRGASTRPAAARVRTMR